jgi:hypothetical protein
MPGNMIMAKAVQSELPIYWIKNETHTLIFYVHKNSTLCLKFTMFKQT